MGYLSVGWYFEDASQPTKMDSLHNERKAILFENSSEQVVSFSCITILTRRREKKKKKKKKKNRDRTPNPVRSTR